MVENRLGCYISHGPGPPVLKLTPLLIINLLNVNCMPKNFKVKIQYNAITYWKH